MNAKPLRTASGSLLIQKQYDYSDRELVEQIMENPYYQYFIGLPGANEAPYVPSLLGEFRKRLDDELLAQINEIIITCNTPDDPSPGSGGNRLTHHLRDQRIVGCSFWMSPTFPRISVIRRM